MPENKQMTMEDDLNRYSFCGDVDSQNPSREIERVNLGSNGPISSSTSGGNWKLSAPEDLNLSLALNPIRTCRTKCFEDMFIETTGNIDLKTSATADSQLDGLSDFDVGMEAFDGAHCRQKECGEKLKDNDLAETYHEIPEEDYAMKGYDRTKHIFVSTLDVCQQSERLASTQNRLIDTNLKDKKITFYIAPVLESDHSHGFNTDAKVSSKNLEYTEPIEVKSILDLTQNLRKEKHSKSVKSFSHELGWKGNYFHESLRSHSETYLEDLMEKLHTKICIAKEEVDLELATFSLELLNVMDALDASLTNSKETMEDLLVLTRFCANMSPSDFQIHCEDIVKDLDDKCHQLPMGVLKQLHIRLLFILTRCTRLFQFHKQTRAEDGTSFANVQQCLRGVPCFERIWIERKQKAKSDIDEALHTPERDLRKKGQSQSYVRKGRPFIKCGSDYHEDINFNPLKECFMSDDKHKTLLDAHKVASNEREQFICRICEDDFPTSHLEAHSMLCAIADACDDSGLSLDECLLNMANVLERMCDNGDRPYFSKIHKWNLHDVSNNSSPKVNDLHSKAMDAKSNFAAASPSAGSLTPHSVLTTPRSSQLDLFWTEHSMWIELQDTHQIHELAEIARSCADKNPLDEGALDYFDACICNLENILSSCENNALALGVFGRRMEGLLREKCALAYKMAYDKKSFVEHRFLDDNGVELENDFYDLRTTPSRLLFKDRTTINDFEILKPISRGAFGKVFLARKKTTGDLFAIKVLRKTDMIRKNAVENILAERDILITVCNPFVVRFFYSFTCRENLYLVMEYLNGGDLFSLLKNMGCLDEHIARVYIAELVLALEYLHSIGVVHRDLKPENILIAHDGHIKLTDFGLSKAGLINSTDSFSFHFPISEVFEYSKVDISSEVRASKKSAVGTPDYLAPEILLGKEHGHAADWWSVGIILFECLMGIPPFNAEKPEDIFNNVLERRISWPSEEVMSCEARDLIEKLLIQNPDERLGSSGAVEVKLHPFFQSINWETLAIQKAAFIPSPETVDDTSYFTWRSMHDESACPRNSSSCRSSATTNSEFEGKVYEEEDECGDMANLCNSYKSKSFTNFSYKNLTQLASMNYDLLSHSPKDSGDHRKHYPSD